MKLEDWKKLQNGSDIRGVALEGVSGENVNLTAEVAEILGKSFAIWLGRNGFKEPRAAIGIDSRITGPMLKEAFSRGLTAQGVDVVDFGLASTPAMFMATIDEKLNVDGAVMLTASHLPFNRNGMKFFTSMGGFDKNDIHDLLNIASKGSFQESGRSGTVDEIDFISDYADILVNNIRAGVNDPEQFEQPLAGLKIIVDAGNGAGGFFAEKVLVTLGADIEGSQFLEPDGNFPNHVPNPEDRDAMDSISAAVKRTGADLGIIFDTDVDRAAVVDTNGKPVSRNELIALISAVILDEHPGSVIVTDSITSSGLKWFIEEELGGVHHRFKRGYRNVINESIRLNEEGKESWLAIETSGHAALKENHFLDDGAYLVAKLLIKMALLKNENGSLTNLIEQMPIAEESREFRLPLTCKDFHDYGNKIISELQEMVEKENGWSLEKPNYEGIRIRCSNPPENGWFLLRLSLHDPKMPLNIESDVQGGVKAILCRLGQLLKEFEYLDTGSML
ncbi:MAG: phosphomannomutase/phosphoglucomutase [Bacteroidales bacterium]